MSSANSNFNQSPLEAQELTRRQFIAAAAATLPAIGSLSLPVSDPARLAQVEAGLEPLTQMIVKLIEFQAYCISQARLPVEQVDAMALLDAQLKVMDIPQPLDTFLSSMQFEREVNFVIAGEEAYRRANRARIGED